MTLPTPDASGWPRDELSLELRRLNRIHLKDYHISFLRGRESWPNQQLERFERELAFAKGLGVVPLAPDQPAFFEFLRTGQRFNWAVLLDGSVRISPSAVVVQSRPTRISHAILCYNGGDVLAAGEGVAEEYLSNTTGHYKNDDFVVLPVRAAFEKIGVYFKA